jgi:hypothetical protein
LIKPVSIAILFVLAMDCFFHCSCSFGSPLDSIKALNISGIVVKKYKLPPGCFGEIVLRQNDKMDTLKNICYCVVARQQVWDYVLPNDSLYKEQGSLVLTVIRHGVKKQFEYPSCIQ